jgi:hypothetical protein
MCDLRAVFWRTWGKIANVGLKIFALFFFLLLLVQLVTGRTYSVNSNYWLRVRLSERPGARVWWGPIWIRRTEAPRLYWGSNICICLMILVLVLAILHKLPSAEIMAKSLMEGVGGLICCLIISGFFQLILKPNRRVVFGIGSLRTVGFYVACVLSAPIILVSNIRLDIRLGLLVFVPLQLMVLGMISARTPADDFKLGHHLILRKKLSRRVLIRLRV